VVIEATKNLGERSMHLAVLNEQAKLAQHAGTMLFFAQPRDALKLGSAGERSGGQANFWPVTKQEVRESLAINPWLTTQQVEIVVSLVRFFAHDVPSLTPP
jgi:hypothetical protein